MPTERMSAREEWGKHWGVPVAAIAGASISVTHWYSFGLFLPHIQKEFSWSRTEIASGLTALSIICVILAPFVGMLIDKYGPRRVAVPSIFLYCGCFALLSLMGDSLYLWWFVWILIGTTSLGIKPTVWTTAVATLFVRGRGLAIALALSGNGLGQAFMPFLSAQMIEYLGWRQAFVGIAAFDLVLAAPLVWLFFYSARDRAHPAGVGTAAKFSAKAQPASHAPNGLRQAYLSPQFAILAIVAFCYPTAATSITIPFVPIVTEQGLSIQTAAIVAGLIGIASILGRLITGALFDRFEGKIVGIAAFTPFVGASLLLIFLPMTLLNAVAVALLTGLGVGGAVQGNAYLTTRCFDVGKLGTIGGTLTGIQIVGGGAGPLLSSFIFDRFGSYSPLMWISALLIVMCMAALSWLKRVPEPAAASLAH